MGEVFEMENNWRVVDYLGAGAYGFVAGRYVTDQRA